MSWNRRLLRVLPLLAVAGLAGACVQIGGGDAGSLYALVKHMWTGHRRVTLAEAAAAPYASLGVRVGNSNQVMLLLAADDGRQRIWSSAARIAVTTRNGRIVRTAGLGHNLAGYQVRQDTLEPGGVRVIRWQGDFPDIGLYSIPITCRDRPAGDETIKILGADIHTRRVDEKCSAGGGLDWSFKNTYWIDPRSGLVWRSIQHVNPKLAALELEILRPPS